MIGTIRSAVAAAALLLALPVQAEDIKIGFIADLSAGAAETAKSGLAGFNLAIEEINNGGGLLGNKVVGIVRDDVGQPPKSIQAMTELLFNEHVAAVVGPTNSGNALAWLHLPQDRQTPVVSFSATASEMTKRYAERERNFIFRVSMVDREQIALLAGYAVRHSPSQKIAVFGDTTGYGQLGIKDATEILALYGITPVAVEKYGPRDTDMTSQLAKAKAAGADTIILYNLSEATAQILRSMEKIDYNPTVLGSWSNLQKTLPNLAGKLAEKVIFSVSSTPDASPAAEAFAEKLQQKGGDVPVFMAAAQAYDSVQLIAAGIQKAGNVEGMALYDALVTLDEVSGVVKNYRAPFGAPTHEALQAPDFHLAHWRDGQVIKFEDDITRQLSNEDLKR